EIVACRKRRQRTAWPSQPSHVAKPLSWENRRPGPHRPYHERRAFAWLDEGDRPPILETKTYREHREPGPGGSSVNQPRLGAPTRRARFLAAIGGSGLRVGRGHLGHPVQAAPGVARICATAT